MKIGFSSSCCPQWDLSTIIARASELDYAAVELCGLRGQLHLPAAPELRTDPARVAAQFRDAGVELVCLGTTNELHGKDRRDADDHRQAVLETVELAGALGCPYVRVYGGRLRGGDRNPVLMRIVDALRELAPSAAACGTTVVVENHGHLGSSRDLWFIVDGVGHPAVQACWNFCTGRLAGESPSLSVPRLGSALAMTQLVDARLGPDGRAVAYAVCGQGDLDVEAYLNLLRGIGYRGPVIFDWPRLVRPELAGPDEVLPAARENIQAMLDRLAGIPELTAYKGDKNAPRYVADPPVP